MKGLLIKQPWIDKILQVRSSGSSEARAQDSAGSDVEADVVPTWPTSGPET
jgi:hypothetical protein